MRRLGWNRNYYSPSGRLRLKVAPFILLSAIQKALRIYVREFPGKNEKLIDSLKELTPKVGVELKIIGADRYKPLNPQIVKMLEAQGMQTPLIKVHTGWLLIKHVDEIFNFIPLKGGKGFKILVPDITITYQLLDRWAAEGKGALILFLDFRENVSVSSLIKNQSLREFNTQLQGNEIEANIKTIKQETGILDDHIIRIPALFEKKYEYAAAMMPNMVNAAYMNGHILMADPQGPIVDGEDLIQKYVFQLLSKEDVIVHFINDLPYHKWHGNVHCATNVTYQPYDIAWWE